MAAEEVYLADTLSCGLLAELLYAVILKGYKSAVAAGDVAVEAIPEFVELAGSGGQCRPDLHGVVACVGESAAAFHAVVRAEVAVGPEVEWVGIPAVAQRCVSCVYHLVRLGISQVAVYHTCRGHIDEVVAGGKAEGNKWEYI